MVSPTEKAEFISQVAAIFKGGSIKERLKDKIIFLFILMVPFIEALLATLKKMDLAGFFSTMALSILVYGKMENLTPIKEYKFILTAAST
jgi:hypothetical protein